MHTCKPYSPQPLPPSTTVENFFKRNCQGSVIACAMTYLHEEHADQHAGRHFPLQLRLLCSIAQRQHTPAHHAHAAIGPGLEVKAAADAGEQLNPCTSRQAVGRVLRAACRASLMQVGYNWLAGAQVPTSSFNEGGAVTARYGWVQMRRHKY